MLGSVPRLRNIGVLGLPIHFTDVAQEIAEGLTLEVASGRFANNKLGRLDVARKFPKRYLLRPNGSVETRLLPRQVWL